MVQNDIFHFIFSGMPVLYDVFYCKPFLSHEQSQFVYGVKGLKSSAEKKSVKFSHLSVSQTYLMMEQLKKKKSKQPLTLSVGLKNNWEITSLEKLVERSGEHCGMFQAE